MIRETENYLWFTDQDSLLGAGSFGNVYKVFKFDFKTKNKNKINSYLIRDTIKEMGTT